MRARGRPAARRLLRLLLLPSPSHQLPVITPWACSTTHHACEHAARPHARAPCPPRACTAHAPRTVHNPQPAVTSANLGQLALDVLISSLIGPAPNKGLRLAARLDCDNVLPCVGNDAYAHQQPGTLATALELYHLQGTPWARGMLVLQHALAVCCASSPAGQAARRRPTPTRSHAAHGMRAGSTTYFLQQRAPAIKGRQAAHAASLCDWLKGQGVAQAVVVCDLDAQARRDAQLDGPPLRCVRSTAVPGVHGRTGTQGAFAAKASGARHRRVREGRAGRARRFLAHCAAHQELCAGRLGLRALEPAFHAEEQQVRVRPHAHARTHARSHPLVGRLARRGPVRPRSPAALLSRRRAACCRPGRCWPRARSARCPCCSWQALRLRTPHQTRWPLRTRPWSSCC